MSAPLPPATARQTMALFFLQPFALGGWFAQIPMVQTKLALSNAELALALLGMPAAFVLMSKFAAAMVAKRGAPLVFKAAFPLQTATVLLPMLAYNQVSLLIALFLFGASAACLTVALNVYAGQVEKAVKASVMNRCHGFWALGLMTGSLLVSLLATPLTPIGMLMLQSAGSAGVGILLARKLPNITRPIDPAQPTQRRNAFQYPKTLYLVALFVFSVTMAEGTMNNWAAVYMADRLAADSALAGLAVTVYSGFLALGRFVGDFLKTRLGGARLAQLTVGIAIIGLLSLIAPLPLPLAFVGFALAGLGVSVGFPLAVSAAAALDDHHEADNIALLSIVAVSGSVIAPPVIGLLADNWGMAAALAALLPGLCISFTLTRYLGAAPIRPSSPLTDAT
ncbi:MFS transporter [Shimia sp. R11_0]|uniref:MFS transporter n=1 Tax=Shimia sp. R11_0 TaxID=2821096 RepID=UPI001ADA4004|nr:MFS transporter [Shimia sp. R11_0]MBO9477637.1 MFS transporter [Shimia sp. R11_0]